MSVTLNGWTAERLDDLAHDVADIKVTLDDMRSKEIVDLKQELADAKSAPRATLTAYLIPLLVALIPTLAVLLHG